MKSRPSVAISVVTLSLGMLIGASLHSAAVTGTVGADATQHPSPEGGDIDMSLIRSSQALAKVAALATPSVVHILVRIQDSRSNRAIDETGSGVIVRADHTEGYFVVTNRHVVRVITDGIRGLQGKLDDIAIHLYDGRVIHPTRLWNDKATDLAILGVEADNLQPARWSDSSQVEIGNIVLAMGSPFGLSRSVTYGIISAKGRRSLKLPSQAEVLNQDFLQTDAAINPGNSGGPLIDVQGGIVGINTAIASNSGGNDGIGFSIPSNLVRQVFDQLLTHGKVERAYLGVKLDPDFDSDTARRLKMDRARGARVVEVYPSTPASRANLQFNDVIVSFDGVDVQDENHLINLVSLTPVGRRIRLSVVRDGQRVAITVELGDRHELEQRSSAPTHVDPELEVVPMGLNRENESQILETAPEAQWKL